MNISEIVTSLQTALTEAAKAHKDLEAAQLKLAPLEQAAKEKDDVVTGLMAQYMNGTGVPTTSPSMKRRGGQKGSTRPARTLSAILLTSASRVFKEQLAAGKKKAEAIKAVMEDCERIAAARGESISTELHGKIEQRGAEIYGRK